MREAPNYNVTALVDSGDVVSEANIFHLQKGKWRTVVECAKRALKLQNDEDPGFFAPGTAEPQLRFDSPKTQNVLVELVLRAPGGHSR